MTFHAIAFGLRSDQVGQRGSVGGVAGQAHALEDRLMNFHAGGRMEEFVVAGHTGFLRAGEHRLGHLGGMTFRAGLLFPFGMSTCGYPLGALAALVAEGVVQQATVAREVRIVTGCAGLELRFNVVRAFEKPYLLVAGKAQVPRWFAQQALIF